MAQKQITVPQSVSKIKLNQNLKKRIISTIEIRPYSRTINEQHFLIQTFKKQLKVFKKVYDRQAILECIDYLKVSQIYNIVINFINPYQMVSKILISQFPSKVKNQLLQSQFNVQSKHQSKSKQTKIRKIGTNNSFLQKIYWLIIINGSLQFQGVKYDEGECLFFNKNDFKFITHLHSCQYVYLNEEDLQKIIKNYQIRENSRCQFFIKNVLLYNYSVSQEQMTKVFNEFKVEKYKKNQIIYEGKPDQYIRILYKGNVEIQTQWKRIIRLCQLTSGCVFNGPIRQQYLKKHELQATTNSKFQNSYYSLTKTKNFDIFKNFNQNKDQQFMQKFRYVCNSEQATILIFNMNLLSQLPLNLNPQLKQTLQKKYQSRVQTAQLIKKQPNYNKLHRMQKSYQKQMKRNKQKQEHKKNVTQIQYLQDQSIRQRFFTANGKVNIFQKPQSYRNNSSQKYLNPRYKKIKLQLTARVKNHLTRSNFFSQHKRNKTINVATENSPIFNIRETPYSTIEQSQPFLFSTQKSSSNIKKVKSFSTLKTRSQRKQLQNKKQQKAKQKKSLNFFVPDQFVNRKLKLQFQSILKKVRTLPVQKVFKSKQESTERQIQIQNNKRFQAYVEEKKVMNKRIMKYYGNSHKYLKK